MRTRWYEKGKLILDESAIDKVYTIAKIKFLKPSDHSYGGYLFYIGYVDNDRFIGLYSLEDPENYPATYKNKAKIEYFLELSYSDIINIKLGHVWIMSPGNFNKWKYDEIEKAFGEDKIQFYGGADYKP